MTDAMDLLCNASIIAIATTSSRIDVSDRPGCSTARTKTFAFRPAAFPVRPSLAQRLDRCIYDIKENMIFDVAQSRFCRLVK